MARFQWNHRQAKSAFMELAFQEKWVIWKHRKRTNVCLANCDKRESDIRPRQKQERAAEKSAFSMDPTVVQCFRSFHQMNYSLMHATTVLSTWHILTHLHFTASPNGILNLCTILKSNEFHVRLILHKTFTQLTWIRA